MRILDEVHCVLDASRSGRIENRIVLLGEVPILLKLLVQFLLHLILKFGRFAVVVQQTVGVGRLHHLREDRCEFALQCEKALCKRGCRRLNAALVGRIDLQVVPERRVQSQQAETLCTRVLALTARVHAAERPTEFLGLHSTGRRQLSVLREIGKL